MLRRSRHRFTFLTANDWQVFEFRELVHAISSILHVVRLSVLAIFEFPPAWSQ